MDDDLTSRVERAVLGALITDPHLVTDLEYLDLRDFADDLHRTVFEAIRSLPDAAATSAGERIADIARAAGAQVSEEYVREVAASCPDPRHGGAYGLRLVQAALYRQMSVDADALGAQVAVMGDEETRDIRAETERGPEAADAARHIGLVSAALRRHIAALVSTEPASAPTQSASGQELREEHVLTALLQQHRESDQILAFLPAAAFTSPERQEILRAIRRLRQASQPVDELTVIWELRVRSDSSSWMRGNPDTDYGASASVARLASASSTGQSPSKTARELLSQLDRRTAADRRPARHAHLGQVPVQASPSAAAGLPANQTPEASGPRQGREPRR